jgi:GNAT superfamily N-acetyltransferase
MGNKALEKRPADLEQGGLSASYKVISFTGHLPDAYLNLIYSKWLRSLRFGNEYFKLIDSDSYYSTYNKYIGAILQRPNVCVRLAVLTDDADVVLGFSVCRGRTLDYVHVHKDQRRQGIGTALVPKDIEVITHLTNTGASIWASHTSHKVIFNPFI